MDVGCFVDEAKEVYSWYLSAGALEISPSWQEQPPISKIFGVIAHRPLISPSVAAATTTAFGVDYLVSLLSFMNIFIL